MQHEYMKPCEYNNILTGLIITLSGLKERRPSAGRRLLVQSIIADIDELCTMLKNEIFERVNREIWLEADEGIDYAALAEQLQTLQPVELVKTSGDEDDIIGNLNRVVEALADLLFGIADALDRHHSNEDYLKLYEDQMKLFFRLRYKNSAIQSYRRWCEKDCLGSPTIEDLEEYRSVKLMSLFRTGIYKERVSSMSRGKHYDNEIVFQVPDDDKVLSQKDIHKHYYCLRKMCDYEDHQLKVIPLQVGIYFYTHRKDENAKEHRIAFLKYMTKVEMAQQQMMEMRKRRGLRLAELTDSRRSILETLAELVGYGEWVAPATDEKILEMLHNALGVGMYELSGEETTMSEVFWSMLEQTGNLRVVWQNLIGYFAEHRFFVSTLGSPALNEMFFGNRDLYQNIDKGRPSYKRKSKKWAQIQPLLDRFVPRKE